VFCVVNYERIAMRPNHADEIRRTILEILKSGLIMKMLVSVGKQGQQPWPILNSECVYF
jgi:hypothetical protein